MSEQSAIPARNGMAVAALFLGVLGLVLSPVLVGAVIGIAGIILGVLALRRRARRGCAIVGIVTGGLSIPVALIAMPIPESSPDDRQGDTGDAEHANDCYGGGYVRRG